MKLLYCVSITMLLFTSFLSLAYADWEIDSRWTIDDRWVIEGYPVAPTISGAEVIFETSSNNAQFGFETPIYIGSGTDFYFYKVEVNSTHLWIDKTYSTKHYTRYCIHVTSPDDVRMIVKTWFPTGNSSAQLQLQYPTSTNINLQLYSPNLISAYATGVSSYTWNSVNQTLVFTGNTDVNSIITIHATVSETIHNVTPENYAVEITDMEGCGNWVFSEEQYYTFQAKYWDGDGYADLDTMKIKFTDGIEEIIAVYNQPDEEWTLESGSNVVNLKAGTKTILDSNLLQVTFKIYFKNKINDALDVDIQMWCNDTSGEEDGWETKETDYFNIYNLGGNSELTSSGNAGRIEGGDVFELYAQNNGNVNSSIIFRNLQHIKMLVSISKTVDVDGEYRELEDIKYYVNYCTENNDWITGWSFILSFQEGYASDPAGGYGSVQMTNWTISWYNQDTLVKTETFHTFLQWVYSQGSMNITSKLWVDMWFNRENASSTIGGRVNAYYFPMRDTANPWLRWLTGTNWGVYEELKKESMFFDTLKDDNGNTLYAQQIKLVQVGCYLNVRDSNYTQRTTLTDYDVFDLTLSSTFSPFRGIQTPVFDETRVPIMPQGGFLGSIFSAISDLGRIIGEAVGPAILGFWNSFVGFLDTVFAFTGNPTFFSDAISWLSSLGGWLHDSFTWLISALTSIFTLLTAFLGKLLNTISTIVTQWVSVFQTFFAMLGGTYTAGINLWDDLGLSSWVIIGAILYPIYLLYIWDTKGFDGVLSHIKMVLDIAAWGITILIHVIQLFINLIGRIIESIPVVE